MDLTVEKGFISYTSTTFEIFFHSLTLVRTSHLFKELKPQSTTQKYDSSTRSIETVTVHTK